MPNFLDCMKNESFGRWVFHAKTINPSWQPVAHEKPPVKVEAMLEGREEIEKIMTTVPGFDRGVDAN